MIRTEALFAALLLAACARRPEPGSGSATVPVLPEPRAAPPAAASPSGAPAPPDGEGDRLDPVRATEAAQAAGMKASLVVTYPVRCPAVPSPRGAPSLLAAKGDLAGLLVDIDGFLREDVGVPEAAALLGPPVLCNQEAGSGYLDMHLAPRDPNAHEVTLETHDGDLIGIVVEYERAVPVDVTLLERRFGAPRIFPGHFESSDEAGSEAYSAENASFRAQLSFGRQKHDDPPTARKVRRVIFRRTSTRGERVGK